MRTVYTMEEVGGRWREHPRIAKETLKARIEEGIIPLELATSYTIASDTEFPFPFNKPNIMEMNGFFGEDLDYNLIARELSELYEQPEREIAESQAKLEAELETASDDRILEMVEEYHYAPKGTKERYTGALAKVEELWKPFDEIRKDLVAPDYSRVRDNLSRSLAILDNTGAQSLLEELKETQESLKSGKRDEAVEKVKLHYSDWKRKNTAPFYHACGNARFYGQGFWIARLVVPEEEVDSFMSDFKRAEEVLASGNNPFHAIEIPEDS